MGGGVWEGQFFLLGGGTQITAPRTLQCSAPPPPPAPQKSRPPWGEEGGHDVRFWNTPHDPDVMPHSLCSTVFHVTQSQCSERRGGGLPCPGTGRASPPPPRMVMCELSRVVCCLSGRQHNMQHMQFARMNEKLVKSRNGPRAFGKRSGR